MKRKPKEKYESNKKFIKSNNITTLNLKSIFYY